MGRLGEGQTGFLIVLCINIIYKYYTTQQRVSSTELCQLPSGGEGRRGGEGKGDGWGRAAVAGGEAGARSG